MTWINSYSEENQGGWAMYKKYADTKIFVITYLVFLLPISFLTYSGMVKNSLSLSTLNMPSILYVLSMMGIWGICLIRGHLIGKHWLVLIPTISFVFNLTPTLSAITSVPYVYHLLAISLGVACPLVAEGHSGTYEMR
jgi:hypothetical protein